MEDVDKKTPNISGLVTATILNTKVGEIERKIPDFSGLVITAIFKNGIFPVINRPTWITKTSENAIDHILTNTMLDFEARSGIIKNDISDHFGIFCVLKTN